MNRNDDDEVEVMDPNPWVRALKAVLRTVGTIFLWFCACTFVCNQNLKVDNQEYGCARN